MTKLTRRLLALAVTLAFGLSGAACNKDIEISVGAARQHAPMLAEAAARDVEELRLGLPEGARQLADLYQASVPPKDDLPEVRKALDRVRNRVQDLRVAKSTFFALAEPDGTILRTDREPDVMSGKNLFAAYPELKAVLGGKLVQSRGSMPEASLVKVQNDGQFVMAVPVTATGEVRGVYASGWSWSAYAYRLENALRSEIRGKLKADRDKDPLVYVFVVVDDAVYGAPVAPRVNAEAIQKLSPLTKLPGAGVYSTSLEITGRTFAVAVTRAPTLGEKVAIAVLRSET